MNNRSMIREKKAVTVPMLTAVFVLCIAYLADASYNPFLYFRF